MAGIRKNKKRKTYMYNKNRKRMSKKKNPKIKCKIVQDNWSNKLTVEKNLEKMGLVYDVNKDIGTTKSTDEPQDAPMLDVVPKLEEEAYARRVKNFRISKNAYEFITYMLDQHGEDYKAMAKDKKNIQQLTWKQIRSKVNVFKGIPEQYNEYLAKKEGTNISEEKMETATA